MEILNKEYYQFNILDANIENETYTVTPRSRNTYLVAYSDFPIVFFDWYLIQAYASFSLVFHKGGEKIHVLPLNRFCLQLVSYSHSLC